MPASPCKSGLTSVQQRGLSSWEPYLSHCFLLLSFHLLIYRSALALEKKITRQKKDETPVNSSHSAKAKSHNSTPSINECSFIHWLKTKKKIFSCYFLIVKKASPTHSGLIVHGIFFNSWILLDMLWIALSLHELEDRMVTWKRKIRLLWNSSDSVCLAHKSLGTFVFPFPWS